MVVPYDNPGTLSERYKLLSGKTKYNTEPDSYDSSQNYASFMKSLTVEGKRPDNMQQTKSLPGFTVNKDNSSKDDGQVKSGVQMLLQMKQKNEQEHQKKMKVVEEHMLQHKQQERQLQRVERDIAEKEKVLKKTMNDYEKEVTRKQKEEDDNIHRANNEMEMLKNQKHIEDAKVTKQHIERNNELLQSEKERNNKMVNTMNSLHFQYEAVADAIRLKRLEVETMAKEFEMKMKLKEEEEFKLKKEFASLAVELNATSQKNRTFLSDAERTKQKFTSQDIHDECKRKDNLEQNKRYQEKKIYTAQANKKHLISDLIQKTGALEMQAREGGRKMMDVQSKLKVNYINQDKTRIVSEQVCLENLGNKSNEKMAIVNFRRRNIQDMITKERRTRNDLSMNEWRMRNFAVAHEVKRQTIKDNINHFEKAVNKHEDMEQALYNQVRSREAERKIKESGVNKKRQELAELKRKNQMLLKETAFRCQMEEKELEQKLLREEAAMKKTLAEREENILLLTKHRTRGVEDKYMLQEEKKNEERLLRIQERTGLIQQERASQEIFS